MLTMISRGTRTALWVGASLVLVLFLVLLFPRLLPRQASGNPTATLTPPSTATATPVPNATQISALLVSPSDPGGSTLNKVTGIVQRVDGQTLVIKSKDEEVKILISDQTINWEGIPWVSKISIEIGDTVIAAGRWNPDHTFAASSIWVNIVNLHGTVNKVLQNTNDVVFSMAGINQELVQVIINPQTRIYAQNSIQSTFQDSHILPREGDYVEMIGRRLSDGSILAVNVSIFSASSSTPLPTETPAPAPQISQQAVWGKGAISASQFSPDGVRLGVVTTQGMYIYDAASLAQLDFIPHAAALPRRSLLAGLVAAGARGRFLRHPAAPGGQG